LIDLLFRADATLLREVVDELQARQISGTQKRAMRGGNDRKRPGWELAYGRKRRSVQ